MIALTLERIKGLSQDGYPRFGGTCQVTTRLQLGPAVRPSTRAQISVVARRDSSSSACDHSAAERPADPVKVVRSDRLRRDRLPGGYPHALVVVALRPAFQHMSRRARRCTHSG